MSTGPCRRGELARMVAARLSARGLSVQVSAPEDGSGLTVTGLPDTHCAITVGDDGSVRFEQWPDALRYADPAAMTRQVMAVLDEHREDWVPDVREFLPDAPVTGPMGRLLQAAGLNVCLTVLEDIDNFDVYPRITATHPETPARGTVSVDDDAVLTWDCRHRVIPGNAADVAEQIADAAARVITAGTAGSPDRAPTRVQ